MLFFPVALTLFFIQIPIKTTLLALQVAIKTGSVAMKGAKNIANRAIDKSETASDLRNRVRSVGNKVGKTANAAKKTVKTTVKTAKTTAKVGTKAAKTTAKVGKNVTKLGIKATKALIHVLKTVLIILKTVITFLISLGVVGLVIVIVVVLIILAVVGYVAIMDSSSSGSSYYNSASSSIASGESTDASVDTSSLTSICKSLAEWYISNISTYQSATPPAGGTGTRTYYTCSLLDSVKSGASTGDDCTSFATAYASLVSGTWIAQSDSKTLYEGDSNYINAGWKRYTTADIGGVSGLKAGDILVCNSEADSKSKGHHAEIYLGANSSFGWGKVQSAFPSSSTAFTDSTTYSGYIEQGTSHRYGVVYRYEGGS